jgi:hypothetical protein
MLRQKDVIGEWAVDSAGRERWSGPYRWDNIPGGIFRLKTSKTRAEIEHDLTGLELLWPLLQRVPQADRHGAIVKAYGQPIRTRSYRKWFREIADAAGLPSSVWNMMRPPAPSPRPSRLARRPRLFSAPRPTRVRA